MENIAKFLIATQTMPGDPEIKDMIDSLKKRRLVPAEYDAETQKLYFDGKDKCFKIKEPGKGES